MYVKCEAFNPLSSVKDRLAIGIIEDAERRGTLKPGQTVVEATSGNTGIALAMVCAVKGYPFVAIMSDSFSVERRKLMRILGAKVILTPAAERATGMVKKAEELAKKNGWFLARQFENPANPEYHRNTTGPGDPARLRGQAARLVGHRLRHRRDADRRRRDAASKARPDVKIVVVEPEGAALLAGQGVEAAQDPGLDAGLHPGGPRPRGLRRGRHGHRRRGARRRARPGGEGRDLLRHLLGRHVRRRAGRSRRRRAKGSVDPRDAARHRRALPLDDPLRGHHRRLGRGARGFPPLTKRGGVGTPP